MKKPKRIDPEKESLLRLLKELAERVEALEGRANESDDRLDTIEIKEAGEVFTKDYYEQQEQQETLLEATLRREAYKRELACRELSFYYKFLRDKKEELEDAYGINIDIDIQAPCDVFYTYAYEI